MALFVFSTYSKMQLSKPGLLDEQIEALSEILATLHEMLQQKRLRPLDRRKAGLGQLRKLAERLSFKLGDDEAEHSLVALIRVASDQERATGGCAFDIDAFRPQVEALCCIAQRADALVPGRMGRRPTLELDLTVIALIHEALRRGWRRREAQGLPMPSRDAGEPSVSTKSGFWVAVDVCLKTLRHGPLTKARKAFVAAYRARHSKTGRRR